MFDMTALQPLVTRVAHSVSSSFPSHYQIEDTEQAIWVWAMENRSTVERVVRDNSEHWEGILYQLMSRSANAYLKIEDAATYGYSEDDVFEYSAETVKTLLESVFSYEDWQSFGQHGDSQPKAKALANQTGDHLAMLVDVKSAVERLTSKQYDAVVWHYKYHWTAEEIAEALDMTAQAARDRLNRAVQSIRKTLGVKPYADLRNGHDGRRAAMGNAQASALVERQYEG